MLIEYHMHNAKAASAHARGIGRRAIAGYASRAVGASLAPPDHTEQVRGEERARLQV